MVAVMGPELDVEVVPAEMNAQDQLEVLCLTEIKNVRQVKLSETKILFK